MGKKAQVATAKPTKLLKKSAPAQKEVEEEKHVAQDSDMVKYKKEVTELFNKTKKTVAASVK